MNRRTKMRRTCMIALAMYSCLAGQTAPAQESGYSDDEVKAQFVEAGTLFTDGGSREYMGRHSLQEYSVQSASGGDKS